MKVCVEEENPSDIFFVVDEDNYGEDVYKHDCFFQIYEGLQVWKKRNCFCFIDSFV